MVQFCVVLFSVVQLKLLFAIFLTVNEAFERTCVFQRSAAFLPKTIYQACKLYAENGKFFGVAIELWHSSYLTQTTSFTSYAHNQLN